MKRSIKNLIYRLLSLFNFKGVSVLMYHSVGWNNSFFTVKPEEFKKQIKWLKKNDFKVLSLEDFSSFLKNGIFPGKSVFLTFDDGYEDNFSNVFPILKKYNFPATIFLSQGNPGVNLKMINTNQIEAIHNFGLVDFSPHGFSHKKLTEISLAEAEKEIIESKKDVEEKTGDQCVCFSYPYGAVNEGVKRLAKKHFDFAFGVKKGKVKKSFDAYDLRRNSIDSSVNFAQFKGKVKFGRI